MLAFSTVTVAVWLMPFDLREVISLLEDFLLFYKCVKTLIVRATKFCISSILIDDNGLYVEFELSLNFLLILFKMVELGF